MRNFLGGLKARIVGRESTTGQAGGKAAETRAAHHLANQGLKLIERNFAVRGGEIDLICQDGDTQVFVEVRMRQRDDFGGAAASITAGKRRRIILAARHWLALHPRSAQCPCRFDVVLLSTSDDASPTWICNAFDADGIV